MLAILSVWEHSELTLAQLLLNIGGCDRLAELTDIELLDLIRLQAENVT